MSTAEDISKLHIGCDIDEIKYQYINKFRNPNKLPINQIHLERKWKELRKDKPKNLDFLTASSKEIEISYFEVKSEILPALDEKWLPKIYFCNYEPYVFTNNEDDMTTFLTKNMLFLEGLEHLLKCNYHQFWCTILFEPSAAVSIRSFLLNAVLPFQIKYLNNEFLELYNVIYNKFILVYEKLILFRDSEIEYMPESFGIAKLTEKKLLNLPIVVMLAYLYQETYVDFINRISNMYFENPLHLDFFIKEVESMVDQNFLILDIICGQLCDSQKTDIVVPISIEKRPAVFSLNWVYSLVTYLLSTVSTLNILLQIYKPAVEMALNKNLPYKLPYIYVTIYRELYELLEGRDIMTTQVDIYEKVLYEINLSRSEFVNLYHNFVTHCLDKTLENMGDNVKQEPFIEEYLKLLTTTLEEDYFICDYNATHNVAIQNDMFESCSDIDSTRSKFIVSCINKLPRNKRLDDFLKLNKNGIVDIFKESAPSIPTEPNNTDPQPGPSGTQVFNNGYDDVEEKVKSITDMFPHLGDGFALQCLESYNFNTADVINAILENNLPPHLAEIPFDAIRIPPEPEPEQPILAYRGKKPDYDDALKLLNDKKEKQAIKDLVLEGVQYDYDHMYDDEYDDRFDDDVAIKVPDNPLTEELATMNPNRRNKAFESEEGSSEDEESNATASSKNKLNFCEDPAVLRERREARFRSKQPQKGTAPSNSKDVVGKPKGQGQDKSVVVNRQKKNVNKSSHANHNRKSGAQWKRNRGMLPL